MVSDKLGDWLTIDNFKMSILFYKTWTLILFIELLLNTFSSKSIMNSIINIILFLIFVVLISIIAVCIHVFGRYVREANSDVNILNPMRERLVFFRFIYGTLLFLNLYSFCSDEISLMGVLRLIDSSFLYLFFLFGSLEYKKPTGKKLKDRIKDLFSSTSALPVPA